METGSLITLKSNAVKNNIAFLKEQLGPEVKISSVVKANAYGHGIEQMIPLLEKEGINHFSVFDYDEAVRVKKSLAKSASVMIMGWIADEDLGDAIKLGFDFFVFDLRRLKMARKLAQNLNLKAKIHLEVETGMNRSGLERKELRDAVAYIKQYSQHFSVEGVCTHLAGPESIANHPRIQSQLKRYRKLLKYIEKHEIKPRYRHVANSAGAFVYPSARMDLVRIGIMQYGFWSSAETFIHFARNRKSKEDPLQRILGWESKIMSIKDIVTGEFVGYGISFLAQSDMKTALIPVGYSCGYSRSLSNKGRILIHGQRCGVIGMVNMNMIIADITTVEEAEIGDEVVIIGQQGELEIKVSAFSNISDRLNYEILAHLPKNIERKVI
jgi:alanine racemase